MIAAMRAFLPRAVSIAAAVAALLLMVACNNGGGQGAY